MLRSASHVIILESSFLALLQGPFPHITIVPYTAKISVVSALSIIKFSRLTPQMFCIITSLTEFEARVAVFECFTIDLIYFGSLIPISFDGLKIVTEQVTHWIKKVKG